MRPRPSVHARTAGCRPFICLCLALCAASPSVASAQQAVAADWQEKYPYSIGIQAYSCVDPSAAMARRRFQDEPCKLPMIHLPLPGLAKVGEPPLWQTYAPGSPETEAGHVMFWRFPVQGRVPHEVPRHSWR